MTRWPVLPHHQEIRATLRLLNPGGGGADRIAETLEAKGVTGRVGNAASCPVAVFLGEQYPGLRFRVADTGFVVWARGKAGTPIGPKQRYERAYAGARLAMFVRRFDNGRYPLLERQP